MKLSEFSKSAPPVSMPEVSPSSPLEPGNASTVAPQEEQIPGQLSVYDALESTDGEAGQYYTSITPSGIEVAYSPAPRRHYKLRQKDQCRDCLVNDGLNDIPKKWASSCTDCPESEWVEVPSVTSVLGVLDKSGPLVWWSQGQTCESIIELVDRGRLETEAGTRSLLHTGGPAATKESLVDLLTEERLSVNHQRDKAADRGVNVHGFLEAWVERNEHPNPFVAAESEQGYVGGLNLFTTAIHGAVAAKEAELMVGSLQHSYAGRFDLVLTLSNPVEVVTKTFPKRKPKVEEIPAGRYLLDLKTSKGIYNTHYLQLEAYEAAAVECGYEPTDHRGVIHVTADGRYELALNKDWRFEDFLSVRACYQTMNERGVVQALRDELDAKEVA